MINIKVKYNKKNSKVFIESTIVLPFLPLVDHEITLDDNNKTWGIPTKITNYLAV